MFNLNSSLFSGSNPWDTNYARTFLQISKDQLEKLNKIPGWSKTSTENDKTVENIDKQLTQQTSTESILSANTNIAEKDNNLQNQNYNSSLHSNQKFINEKEIFLKNFSLTSLKENKTPECRLKRSSSLSDLHQELQPHNKQANSAEKVTQSSRTVHLSTINLLNETYTVPLSSDDGITHEKLLETNSRKSFSCPLEQPDKPLKQKTFKALDDSILNHKYLRGSEASLIKSDTALFSSKEAVPAALKQKMSMFEKKLLLLENRLSPCKEMSPQPFNAKINNIENFNCKKNLTSVPADEVVASVISSDSIEILPDKMQNSSVSNIHESLELQANLETLNEKSDACESNNGKATDISKTTICNFDSFLSPSIPCGQSVSIKVPSPKLFSSQESVKLNTLSKSQNASPPIPCGQSLQTEISLQTQKIPSQESSNLNTPSKFQKASLPVPCGQPIPMEVPSITQQILPQKLVKLNTPNKPQNAELFGNIIVPEQASGGFGVFSTSSNEKISDAVPSKELGTKRKRRSKSEKSSKKLDVKKIKRVDIQFSSAQIKSMMEIMKIFHTEF